MVYIAWWAVYHSAVSEKLISFLHTSWGESWIRKCESAQFAPVQLGRLLSCTWTRSRVPPSHIYVVWKEPIKKVEFYYLTRSCGGPVPRRAVWCHGGQKLHWQGILLLEQQINFKFESPTSFGSVTNIIIIQAGCQRWRRKKENAQEQHLDQSATKDQKSALFIADDLKIF